MWPDLHAAATTPRRRCVQGDIAVVDLTDLDRSQAEALVERRVRAVINAAESSTGRYPNLGPRILADAGITLIDQVGQGVWTRLKSGETVRVDGNRVFRGESLVAQGVAQDDAAVTASLGEADKGLSTRLESLMANATDHLQRERAMLLEGARVPRLGKRLRKRPVVVVSKTFGWQNDLQRIRKWIRERDPVLIGVADGADALLDAGYKPHVVLGTLDELSSSAFHSGAAGRGHGDLHPRQGLAPSASRRPRSTRSGSSPPGRRTTSRSCSPTPTRLRSSSRSARRRA